MTASDHASPAPRVSVAPIGSPMNAADLRERVRIVVDEFIAAQAVLLGAVSPSLEPLVDAIVALLAGGKRLRPAFCYWGWRGAAIDPSPEVDAAAVRAAASLEFLQACALIHDDVMDGSDTRRGQPSAHHRFANLHRRAQWLGSPEAFGTGSAILLGDLCLSWADQVLLTSGMPADARERAKAVYDEMRTELMAGQYLDLLEQALGGGSVDRAMTVIRYKSAKYTIERPLHLGAALAGAGSDVTDAYSAYGLTLGEAFQLRDDVLGVFGNPEQTGKPAGDDLREGKRTLLIALATKRANTQQADILRTHLGDPHLEAAGIEALREVIRDTDALAETEQRIEARLSDAIQAIADAPIDAEARSVLIALAHAAATRSR